MKLRNLALCGAAFAAMIIASGCSAGPSDSGAASTSAVTQDDRVIATIQLADFSGRIKEIRGRDLDIAGVDLDAKTVDVVVERDFANALKSEGFSVIRTTEIPSLANRDEFDTTSYRDPAAVESLLKDYAQRFPQLAQAVSVGKSGQNRDIWALRITKDVQSATGTPKPVILFNGAHHAREVMSVEVPVDTIDTLLGGYGTDPKVTHWVDANEIWVMPMFNVDGVNQVFTHDTMWRKNAAGCPATGVCASHGGVDINRNYPFEWNSCNGSSSSKAADDYHGPSAASEPETNVMMDLVGKIRPVFDISYHSYSEIVLYPFGCEGEHVPNQTLVAGIGAQMAAKLPTDDSPTRNYKPGTPWELLYSADGGDMDWMYHQYNVMAYAIEVNGTRQGFQPSYSQWRQKTVTKLRAAWELMLDRVDGSGVRGLVHGAPANATVTVAPTTAAAGTTETRPVNPDGSFHVVTLPGTFNVTVSAPGHTAFTQQVTVAAARVDLDITLP